LKELTPRQFDALLRRHIKATRYAREQTELLFGQLTAAVINWSWRPPKSAVDPGKFMPSRWKARGAVKRKRQSKQAIANRIREAMGQVMKFNNVNHSP
jgi:hypothetical protein